jgi:hypothetical protein
VQDIAPVYEIDPPPDLPPQAGESLEAYLQRTLGDAAILPAGQDDDEPTPSTERRRRLQRMEQAAQAEPLPHPFRQVRHV